MNDQKRCESCGMPLDSAQYCQYCVDENGNLRDFDELFSRMVAWQAKRNPADSADVLERDTLAYLANMPAWRNHPRVIAKN